MVKECLKKTGLEPRYLELEITEGIAMKESRDIVESLKALKKLGLNVTAEGVETVDQLGFLKDENCDDIQGYYYYPPLTKDEIEENSINLFN